ncbi:MAG: UDP-N-acetylmuramyl tripeptide synthase [Arenicella sp.]
MKIVLDEVRRLTGPNLLWDKPGAILDVLFDGVDASTVIEYWQKWSNRCLLEMGWNDQESTHRIHAHGANLAISAPLDLLYVACDLAEVAWSCCLAECQKTELPDWSAQVASLKLVCLQQANADLLQIVDQAETNNVLCLLDDDEISLGAGASAKVWPIDKLPPIESIQWAEYSSIPCAFVTGTNGKSTCVRLAAEIAKFAGVRAGVTSTDFIKVGDRIVDHGDYSGPGGARMLLRDSEAELAFLEVARGGLLRRGLPVNHVDAALITNVASDHLGEYGINTVAELAETKFIVSKGLSKDNVLVLNADDQNSIDQAVKIDNTICWFSTRKDNPIIIKQIEEGGRAVYLEANKFVYHEAGVSEQLIDITEAPMTFDGTASHNVQNALGVIGLCKALKLPSDAINLGLKSFGRKLSDNPGRGNQYEFNDIRVIVDFAHNDHGVSAMVDMVSKMPAKRKIVMFGHAGDRSDADIIRATQAVTVLRADFYIISELEKYLRGRAIGEVPTLAKSALSQQGLKGEQVIVVDGPLEGAKKALELALPGDVVLLFALHNREAIDQLLSERLS